MASFNDFPRSKDLMNATAEQASSGQIITVTYVPNGDSVSFKAFVTAFSDKFSTNYNSEEVYGRMDPVQLYKGTQRAITISFDVPSESVEEAKANLDKCSMLAQMQYPVFGAEGPGLSNATSMQAAPLFKLKFGNLIQNSETGGGLTGTMAGFSYEPQPDSGFYTGGKNSPVYYPKLVTISIEFTPQHEHGLGYGPSGSPRPANFPYGTGNSSSTPPAPDPEDVKVIEQQNLDNQVADGTANQNQVNAKLEQLGDSAGVDFQGNKIVD